MEWIAVEIKRIATIDAVGAAHALPRAHSASTPRSASCRGVLAAQTIKPQARVLAESRGIDCVEVDPAVLRGEREPELKLFALTSGPLARRQAASPLAHVLSTFSLTGSLPGLAIGPLGSCGPEQGDSR